MYLIYVDESGTPSIKDIRSNYYILSAVIVCERDWKTIDNGIEKIKQVHFGSGATLEIHSREIYRRTKVYSHLTAQKAEAILGDVYSLISSSNLTLLTVTIDKQKLDQKDPNADGRFTVWKLLLERINMCIDCLNMSSGAYEYGLIIMDETVRAQDEQVRLYMKYLKENGTGYQLITKIVEDPVFSPSSWRNLIQLADAIAYCCQNFEKKEPFFQQQYLTIQNKFHSDGFGKIRGYGYKSYP